MSSPKPIQIILARQLASSLAMPILIVDTEGTLIFYNEPAEVILDQRFDETGEMPADVLERALRGRGRGAQPHRPGGPAHDAGALRAPAHLANGVDAVRQPGVAAREHHGISRSSARRAQFLGAQMIFWEV